jgi:hypothetical protein
LIKAGTKINENEITAANETLWGKLAQEKMGAFIPKYYVKASPTLQMKNNKFL